MENREFCLSPAAEGEPSSVDGFDLYKRDSALMQNIIRFTARTLSTPHPVPFGALIADSSTGEVFLRALNAVKRECDPSSHAELRAIRKASRKRGNTTLQGFTLYSTCEPCPMCMASALWAGLDRVVYGATIDDANLHCRQIHIPAREVSARSDMPMPIEGPLLRDDANALFTHENMRRAFATWNPRGPWVPAAIKPTYIPSSQA
jgi:tRNA(Arg) A34 adenosine deaminase TadA